MFKTAFSHFAKCHKDITRSDPTAAVASSAATKTPCGSRVWKEMLWPRLFREAIDIIYDLHVGEVSYLFLWGVMVSEIDLHLERIQFLRCILPIDWFKNFPHMEKLECTIVYPAVYAVTVWDSSSRPTSTFSAISWGSLTALFLVTRNTC